MSTTQHPISNKVHIEPLKSAELKGFKHVLKNREINLNYLILGVVIFLVATANIGFFKQVLSLYPLQSNLGFFLSLIGLLFGLMWLVVQLLTYRPIAKFVLITLLLVGAVCGYFTDAYGTIFDTNMLINSMETDHAEAMGLFSFSLVLRLLLLGIVPAIIIFKLPIKRLMWRYALIQRVITLVLAIAVIAVCLLPFGDQYASFFRQHKMVRNYTNPITPIYSSIKLGTDYLDKLSRPDTLIPHATDAKRVASATQNVKPKLMVFVVGEAARADHISLNGYPRDTMPLLAKQANIYSFKEAISCGTSTAYSVPCMFSYAGREDYDSKNAPYHENVLDTLHKLGVNVIWRDNNSSSKGVADRVMYQEFKTSDNNPVCDSECRDIGMLEAFNKLVTPQDTLVVLHQMGNHGPAYYERYPKEFEVFKPVCMTNELSKCDTQSVINGYDNAIRYTDYFLNSVIETLKPYQQTYDVVMIYVSDHGESLGENNIYLHGLPYSIAPNAQKHIPVIIWSPLSNHIDKSSIEALLNKPVSHDYITPTLLNFYGITSRETQSKPTFFKTLSE